jgi:HEAT repeat protein
MNGAVEGMIAVLEDPSATNPDAALAGLVERYDQRGPDVLRPFKDRFRKLLHDRDPGVRRVACWALGRMGDLDVVAPLVRALLDPEDGVVAEARVSLELLSRKAQGYGPARGATLEQKVEAARLWRAWYESIRPTGLDPLDEIVAPKAAAGGGS